MYLWNYHALAKKLKEQQITARNKFGYLLLIMLYVPTGLMGSNWIPGIYRLLYRVANMIITRQAPRVHQLKLFNNYNYATDIATIVILGIGILICYIANKKGDGKRFIERFMCLIVPVSIKIGTYFLLVFLTTLSVSLIYFNFKLQTIANINGFLKGFKKLRHLKELSPVMAYISYRMHILSCLTSLTCLAWCLKTLRSEIAFVANKSITK